LATHFVSVDGVTEYAGVDAANRRAVRAGH
jgi:hypothetical protein